MVSRLRYDQDDRTVVVLAPVAVRTDRQGQGIGQQLLRYGLEALRGRGVDVVLTYGDPAYYGKVGFGQITEDVAQAPLPLSFPDGWLGQSLTDEPLTPLRGACCCVPALNSPEYWCLTTSPTTTPPQTCPTSGQIHAFSNALTCRSEVVVCCSIELRLGSAAEW